MNSVKSHRLHRVHTVSIIASGGVALLTLVVGLLFTGFIPSASLGVLMGLITGYLASQQDNVNKITSVTAFVIVVIFLLSAIATWVTVPSSSEGLLPNLRELGTAAFALVALLSGVVGRWAGNRDGGPD